MYPGNCIGLSTWYRTPFSTPAYIAVPRLKMAQPGVPSKLPDSGNNGDKCTQAWPVEAVITLTQSLC